MKEHESLSTRNLTLCGGRTDVTEPHHKLLVCQFNKRFEGVRKIKSNVQQQSNNRGNERPYVLHTLTSWS